MANKLTDFIIRKSIRQFSEYLTDYAPDFKKFIYEKPLQNNEVRYNLLVDFENVDNPTASIIAITDEGKISRVIEHYALKDLDKLFIRE